MNILIADDDPISNRLLEATLVRLGHQVVAVADGQEAIDTLLRNRMLGSHRRAPRRS